MNDVLEKADQAVKRREAIALCTVVETVGSVPMKPGAKLLVWQDGRSYGTIGGGNVEKQVIDDAIQLIGEYKSEAAFTDSTTPIVSPVAMLVPTAGNST